MSRRWCEITPVLPQELELRVRGDDVLRMQPHASPEEEGPLPDLGELFVTAIRAGLFGGAAAPSWQAEAAVIETDAQLDQRQARWLLGVAGVDLGAFRILWNVLGARTLDDVALTTRRPLPDPGSPTQRLDPARIAYPGLPARLPFELSVEPPTVATRDRSVQVVFQHAPPAAVVDEALAMLGRWMDLLMLGGYPEDGRAPGESGAFPDAPFQLDEATVQLAFPEMFVADEAAFHAVVHGALALHARRAAVEAVIVR